VDDAGVVDPSGGPRLAQEALAELPRHVVVEVDPEGLERQLAVG